MPNLGENVNEYDKLAKLAHDMLMFITSSGCEGCVVKSRCNDGLLDECIEVADFKRRYTEMFGANPAF